MGNKVRMVWCEEIKANIPDLNYCPSCGELLCITPSLKFVCLTDECKQFVVFRMNKKGFKTYYPEA